MMVTCPCCQNKHNGRLELFEDIGDGKLQISYPECCHCAGEGEVRIELTEADLVPLTPEQLAEVKVVGVESLIDEVTMVAKNMLTLRFGAR